MNGAPHEVTSTTTTGVSGQQAVSRLRRRTGAWCWRRRANRLRHKKRWKNFAARTGDRFSHFCDDKGIRPDEAEDITQGFFAELLERRSLEAVRKEKGRLRSFLLGGLKYFLANEQRRAMAIKRGKGQRLIPLEELRADDRIDMEPADPMTAEMIYERRWALTVLERVLSRLKDEYLAADNAALFDSLKELLPDEPGSPSQAEIAARLGMTENAIRQAFYRFRQRYQALLREEIANTVATPGDIEDELRHLIAVLEA